MPDTLSAKLLCLDCDAELSESRWIRHVAVCGNCGAMMALVDGAVVKGTGAHADSLTLAELKQAQAHRGPFRRRPRR